MIELYGKIAWLTIIMWSFYPVVWLFSEGFASFSVSFEVLLRAPSPTPPPPHRPTWMRHEDGGERGGLRMGFRVCVWGLGSGERGGLRMGFRALKGYAAW